jgi:hypothetical protein
MDLAVSKPLGEILQDIEKIERRKDGRFVILIHCAMCKISELRVDTPCDIVFIRNEEEEAFADCELASVSLAQEVVGAAKLQKPECSQEELVESLKYYLVRDAFMPLQDD